MVNKVKKRSLRIFFDVLVGLSVLLMVLCLSIIFFAEGYETYFTYAIVIVAVLLVVMGVVYFFMYRKYFKNVMSFDAQEEKEQASLTDGQGDFFFD